MKKNYFAALFLLLFFLTDASAQSPDSFNYQAVIRDASSSNILANQQVSLLITLRQNNIDGTIVYEEEFNQSTNTFGLVNLEIGNGNTVLGTFEDIDWGSGPYFIETSIDQTGGNNHISMGTSQLLSVPYALYAKNGSKWNDSEFDLNVIQNDKSVLIGKDRTSEVPFFVNNSNDVIGPFTNTAIGQFRTEYNGSGATFLIYGYPDTDLVYPHLRKSVMLYATEDAEDIVICAAKPEGRIRFFTQSWADPNSEKMIIDQNGNVGIGELNPEAYMHVSGSNARTLMDANGISSSVGHQFRSFSNTSGQESEGEFRLYNTNKFVFNRGFFPNQTEVMAIDLPTGNVGIGTLNPAVKLQIEDGDIYIGDINKGVIVKSPNGLCWRMTIDNTGNTVTSQISCP